MDSKTALGLCGNLKINHEQYIGQKQLKAHKNITKK